MTTEPERAPELSDGELAEIEARAAAATEGPWEADGSEIYDAAGDWVGESLDLDAPDGGETNARFAAAARTDVPRLVAALRAAREELMRVRHALTVIQAARPPLAHSAAIVEQLALSIRAREMKPAQIASEEAERGYHNAINGYREVARAILRGIDKALTFEEGADRGQG